MLTDKKIRKQAWLSFLNLKRYIKLSVDFIYFSASAHLLSSAIITKRSFIETYCLGSYKSYLVQLGSFYLLIFFYFPLSTDESRVITAEYFFEKRKSALALVGAEINQ